MLVNDNYDENNDNSEILTKGILWKQGRGRSISFIKPWRERLLIVDHKKMTLSYYNIPEGLFSLFLSLSLSFLFISILFSIFLT